MSTTTVRGVADLRVDGAPSEQHTRPRATAPAAPLSGSGPAGPWVVTDEVLVRRATLPVSALEALRSETLRQATSLSRSRGRLEDDGRALADELYPMIGAVETSRSECGVDDRPTRGALVGARRALHTGRLLTGAEAGAVRLLPDPFRRRVTAWQREVTALTETETLLDQRLTDELATDLPRLVGASRSPEFRHALSVGAGSLALELDKLDRDPRRTVKVAKKVRLVKFLARAATKASPYSSFLSTSSESWRPSGAEAGAHRDRPGTPRLTRQLDQVWVSRLTARTTEDAIRRGVALVRTNPSLTPADGAWLVLRGDRQEPAALPDHPVVRRWVDLVDELTVPGGPCPDLTRVRSTARDAGLDPADVDRLVSAGVLELFVPVDDVDPDPVGALRTWLHSMDDQASGPEVAAWAHREAERLDPLAEALGRPGPLDDGRSHRDLVALADRLTSPVEATDRSMEPEDPSPADHVHEVLVADSRGRGTAPPVSRSSLEDLDVARRWLALFSWKHPVRVVFATWLRERFGPGCTVPLVTAMATVRSRVSRPTAELTPTEHLLQLVLSPGAMPWFLDVGACEDPRLLELDRLRRQALAGVDRPDAWSHQVRLDPVELARQLAELPPWLSGCPSAACYVQPVPDGHGTLVLNAMHLGRGRARSRHAGLLAGREPLVGVPADDGAGPMEAELAGHFGSSMNARVPTLPYVVDAPGAVSTRDAAERLAPGRLEVRHDPATDLARLWSPVHDREVVPYHVGMMGEMGLSPLATFLDRVFSPSFVVHASVSLQGAASLPSLVGMRREPRVSVGSVVVQRARTTLPADQVPVARSGRTGAADLLALARWRHEHGLPEMCFTRAWSADQHSLDHKGRKPLLVDFQNWYTVEAFAAQVRAADVVVVEEAHPDLLAAAHADQRLTELMVEISDAHRTEEIA